MMKLVRDKIVSLSRSANFFRHFAEEAKQNEELKNEKENKLLNTAIMEYLHSTGSSSLINELPLRVLQNRCTAECMYLVDESVAEKFCDLIEEDILKGSSTFVAEINPGLGLLTEKLVKTTVPKIHLYEPTSTFTIPNSRLQSIIKKYPDRLELRKENLLRMWGATFLDLKDGGHRFLKMVKGIEERKWDDEPYMKVVGTVANNNLIKHLLMSVIFQNGLVDMGRISLYLAMPPSDWIKLTAPKNLSIYKPRPVLFQAFFNYQKLGTLPRKAFLPWPVFKRVKILTKLVTEFRKKDIDSLYVVKIEPKPNLLNKIIHQENLFRFFFFVKHHMQKNHIKIIPALEKWIPHCGPRLIAKNITIYTEFQDLHPEELLELYIEFSSWPEFETSQFLEFTTTFINRIEEGVCNIDPRYGTSVEKGIECG